MRHGRETDGEVEAWRPQGTSDWTDGRGVTAAIAITVSESSVARWSLYRKELSRRAFMKRFPHPFFLLGEAAQQTDADFFTQHVTRDPDAGDMFTEEQEVVPLVKGAVNPYADRVIIGRARNCDVVFRTQGISKVHADLRVTEIEGAELADRGSTNGTFVAGNRLMPGKCVKLVSGDLIQFALVRCLFLGPGQLYDRL